MKHFKIKEAEKAESSNARAFTKEPSGASTNALQVISSEFWVRQAAILEAMSGVLGGVDELEVSERVMVLLLM